MINEIIVGVLYTHIKSGKVYRVLSLVWRESDRTPEVTYMLHTSILKWVFNPIACTKSRHIIWTRPLDEFCEKFMKTPHPLDVFVDDVRHICWLAGIGIKALFRGDLKEAKEAWYWIITHITYEHRKLTPKELEKRSKHTHDRN